MVRDTPTGAVHEPLPAADAGAGAETETVPDTGADTLGPRRLTSVPALDGVRGMAILIVVVFHGAGLWRSLGPFDRGGALGVDAFFVLSGFLITALLLREQAERGSVRIGGFYRRRALRLLPALIVLLAAQIIYSVLTHELAARERESVFSVLFYYSNTWLHQRLLSPGLQGLWSLAVEEQFYLVWPLLLLLFLGLRRKLPTVVGIMIGLIAAVSVYRTMRFDQGVAKYYIYTRTITRADALLIGALLAQLWVRRKVPKRGVTLLAWPALAFYLYAVVHGVPDSFLYRGGYTLVALSVALILLAVLESSWKVNDFLRLRPLRTLGRISYALYIWHLFIFPAVEREGHAWAPLTRVVVALALCAVACAASWTFVEQPFLRWKVRLESGEQARVVPVRAIAIVLSALVIGSVVLWVNGHSSSAAATGPAAAVATVPTFTPTNALVAVPDLAGQNAYGAAAELTAAHLHYAFTSQASSTSVGSVLSQRPVAGTRVRGGTVVHMTISKGSSP